MLLKDCGKKLAIENTLFYLAVISAGRRFSSKDFKKLMKVKNIKFASPEEVFKVTGCRPGAVPPFGSSFSVPTVVEKSLSEQASINFNCGLRTHSVSLTFEDYIKIEKPMGIFEFAEQVDTT
mmetsp:Transcript_12874/g.8971  ORF Transcript_12874/g.8971 Transcript_12874/m.8971 type:complete len:122 (+) Transcript_12874:229-594(+)